MESLPQRHCSGNVVRDYRSGEAIFGIIGHYHSLVVAFERNENSDRAKDFLAVGRHLLTHAFEYRRLHDQTVHVTTCKKFSSSSHTPIKDVFCMIALV